MPRHFGAQRGVGAQPVGLVRVERIAHTEVPHEPRVGAVFVFTPLLRRLPHGRPRRPRRRALALALALALGSEGGGIRGQQAPKVERLRVRDPPYQRERRLDARARGQRAQQRGQLGGAQVELHCEAAQHARRLAPHGGVALRFVVVHARARVEGAGACAHAEVDARSKKSNDE